MIGRIGSKRKDSEDAEREFVAGVCFVGFVVAQEAPDEKSPEMGSRTEEHWTCVPSEVVDENVFDGVSVLAGDASCVNELVMLFVEHLIQW